MIRSLQISPQKAKLAPRLGLGTLPFAAQITKILLVNYTISYFRILRQLALELMAYSL